MNKGGTAMLRPFFEKGLFYAFKRINGGLLRLAVKEEEHGSSNET
ncbi:hypothetical protein RYX38_09835 [Lacticaseibacillus rhamnosus]|nr:hypothetical protein [Lacticaseibacillus rhamnosus]GEM59542.1 hypothetical protein LR1_02240 [Lacticaseibacillus rhamnosus DSM 20021 = JCM 1136 = NBRC 3425]